MSGHRRLSRHSYYNGGIGLIRGEYGLYVDESGQSDASYYVVVGILAHQSRIAAIKRCVEGVMRRHGGSGEPKFWRMMEGSAFTDSDRCRSGPAPEIMDIIGDEQMPFFTAAVDRDGSGTGMLDGYGSEDHYATERVIVEALDYVASEQSHVRIIRDRGNDETDRRIRRSLNRTGRSGAGDRIANLDRYRGYEARDSEGDPGLWIADSCVGAVARTLNWNDPGCYDRIRWLQDIRIGGRTEPAIHPLQGGI
ncbi:hypothetical protein IBTHAUMO2_1090012 [Nitrosopumilaceae archaeon]|nr:DUF3800 domain-containing protein [Nitrosopumilus sp.]CAI9830782.1 hypothetical protein IBTHAUMO2_1090012 [Nitrosopumilaceae archaeon]